VFEETGRLVAFKTVLKNRKNRENGISYGIGHGGFEVIFILGLTFLNYIIYAVMINAGQFETVVKEVAEKTPEQVDALNDIAATLAAFSVGDLGVMIIERISAVFFHIGGSIVVFYACKDRKKFWLYPFAILLHTMFDGCLALNMKGIISLSAVQLEIVFAVFAVTFFSLSYVLLYRKDPDTNLTMITPVVSANPESATTLETLANPESAAAPETPNTSESTITPETSDTSETH